MKTLKKLMLVIPAKAGIQISTHRRAGSRLSPGWRLVQRLAKPRAEKRRPPWYGGLRI